MELETAYWVLSAFVIFDVLVAFFVGYLIGKTQRH